MSFLRVCDQIVVIIDGQVNAKPFQHSFLRMSNMGQFWLMLVTWIINSPHKGTAMVWHFD